MSINYEVRAAVPDEPFVTRYGDYTMAASKVRELRARHPDAEVRLFRRIIPQWEEVTID